MPCYLLHMIEAPQPTPYSDPGLKDLVGQWPQLFCAYCSPPRNLPASDAARCLGIEAPCWKPTDQICPPVD